MSVKTSLISRLLWQLVEIAPVSEYQKVILVTNSKNSFVSTKCIVLLRISIQIANLSIGIVLSIIYLYFISKYIVYFVIIKLCVKNFNYLIFLLVKNNKTYFLRLLIFKFSKLKIIVNLLKISEIVKYLLISLSNQCLNQYYSLWNNIIRILYQLASQLGKIDKKIHKILALYSYINQFKFPNVCKDGKLI